MAKKFSTGIVNNLSKSRIIAVDACLPFLLSARPSALGAGDYMRLADKREQAGGGRAKVDGMPYEGILFSFVFACLVAIVLARFSSRPSSSRSSPRFACRRAGRCRSRLVSSFRACLSRGGAAFVSVLCIARFVYITRLRSVIL